MLIGIDVYSGQVPPLEGCVNDIDAIQKVLLERLHVPKARIKRFAIFLDDGPPRPTEVPTCKPTRANLLAALTELVAEVKPGDRVFIYHSGHGMRIPEVIDQNGKRFYHREALVTTDYGVDGKNNLLYDWELNRLIGAIAGKTSAVTVVLDCCCSAGAMREVPKKGVRARFVESPQPIVLPPEILPPPATGERGLARGLAANVADFMVVAACLDIESAQESRGSDGASAVMHGVLTRALLEQLETLGDTELSELRWGRIWRAVGVKMAAMNANQHPWLSSNPARQVFGGPPEQGDVGYAVTLDEARATYHLDAGSLVGVTRGAVVALYPPLGSPGAKAVFPPVGSREDLEERIGLLRVTSADRAASAAIADPAKLPPSPLDPGVRGRLIAAGEDAKLEVALAPYDAAVAKLLRASPFLEVVEAQNMAGITLVKRSDEAWAITDSIYGTGEEAGPPVPTLPFLRFTAPPDGKPDIAVKLVEHYYRFTAPLRMAQNCTDLRSCLVMTLLDCKEWPVVPTRDQILDPQLPELQLGKLPIYEVKAGRYDSVNRKLLTEGDFFCVRITNTSNVDLWVTLFNCDADGRVTIYESRALVQKNSHATFWHPDGGIGDPIGAALSDGMLLGVDRYVAIATTDERALLNYLEVETSFAQIANGVGERPGVSRGTEASWTSAVVVVRMTVP